MNIRAAVAVALAVVAIAAVALLGPWQRGSEAIGPDINDDGIVDLPNDILGVILACGQHIRTPTPEPSWTPFPTYTPYPTYTPFPTSTPTASPSETATPQPQTGGGNEQVLAFDVTVQPGYSWTNLATIDSNVCKGLIFYLAARSTDSIRATVFEVDGVDFENNATLQVGPNWGAWISEKTTQRGLVTFSVRVPATDLYPARFVLEAHCEPAHP